MQKNKMRPLHPASAVILCTEYIPVTISLLAVLLPSFIMSEKHESTSVTTPAKLSWQSISLEVKLDVKRPEKRELLMDISHACSLAPSTIRKIILNRENKGQW